MPTTGKVTPKAGITLLSKQGDSLQFAHSASASGEFNVKQKLGKKLTLGVGFTVREHTACCTGMIVTDQAYQPISR
jgi:hypothetical protein